MKYIQPLLMMLLTVYFIWTPSRVLQAESVLWRNAKLELVKDGYALADGPSSNGTSLFIPDVLGGALHQYSPKTGKQITRLQGEPRTLKLSATYFNHGRLFAANNGASAISEVVISKNKWQLKNLVQHESKTKPFLRPNDLVVDKFGGIYYTITPKGEVWYFKPGEMTESITVVPSIKIPNGLILSPDESTLYVSTIYPKEIYAYQVLSPGKLSEGRRFAKMGDDETRGGDGMTVDRAGNVYCCGPAYVWVWSPSGQLLDRIKTPTRPINAAFCGPDPQYLYITCMKDKNNPDSTSSLYRIMTRIQGVSPTPPTKAATFATTGSRPSIKLPPHISRKMGLVYASAGDRQLLMDLYQPQKTEAQTLPAIVVVHGGGWQKGDRSKFTHLAIELARRGYVTANIEYRLAREAKFPAAIHDCNAAVRYLKAHAQKLGINPNLIGVVGGSAGGHLAGLMASGWKIKANQGTGGYPDQSSQLKAAVVLAGPMQIATGNVADRSITNPKSNAIIWFGGTIEEKKSLYEQACAHMHIDKDTPPILFMTGELDDPTKNDSSMQKLKSLGIQSDTKIYQNGKHGCWNQLPWFNDMVADIDIFLKQHLK